MKKFLSIALFAGSLSLIGANSAEAGAGCYCPAPATAQAPQAQQRYSYQPGVAPRAVYAPMRRAAPSWTPSYLLPKSDPRKFNAN